MSVKNKPLLLCITIALTLFLLISACSVNQAHTQAAPSPAPAAEPTAAPKVKKLLIARAPDKVEYVTGEQLDDTGAVINAAMSDGSVMENVPYTVELGIADKNSGAMVFSYGGKSVYQYLTIALPGNAPTYSVSNTPAAEHSPLAGKRLYFLGSSVTLGAHSDQEAIPEFMDKVYGTQSIKEALSGTTLAVSKEPKSYAERFDAYLQSSDRTEQPDCFIVQLSTNDTSKVDDLGTITQDDVIDPAAFDKRTTFGAMEYIIAMAKKTWNCPVVFYTNPPFGLDRYKELVDGLYTIARKWDVTVIDLYNDTAFNDITQEQYALYMDDSIHPTKAGYRDWWLPKFYEVLSQVILSK